MLIISIAFSIILQNVQSHLVIQEKNDCCIFNFVNKDIMDLMCMSIPQKHSENCLTSTPKRQYPRCYNYKEIPNCYPDHCTPYDDGCYFITKKGPYDETSCPYNYAQVKNLTTPIWYPARRNLKRGFGDFIIEEIGPNYGKIIRDFKYKYPKLYTFSNCMILDNDVFLAVPCSHRYSRSCKYKLTQKNDFGYCNTYISGCFNAHFNTSTLKCLCHRGLSTCNVQSSCKDFATSYLINPQIFQESELDLKLTLQCDVCETDFPYIPPKYTFFNGSNLSLKFQSAYNLVTTEAGRIFCFTDGYPAALIHKVEITEGLVDDTLSVVVDANTSGHYWCEAFEVKDFKTIRTLEIWVQKENVYAMDIIIRFNPQEDPTDSRVAYHKYLLEIERLYNSRFNKGIQIKWMETKEIDNFKRHVKYLIHICTKFSWDLHDIHHSELIKNLPKILAQQTYVVQFTEIYSTSFCMENISTENNHRLTWPKTLIKHDAASVENCLTPNGTIIQRHCGGDYFEGGRWDDVEPCFSEASIESHITKNLSDILHSNLTTPEMIEEVASLTEDSTDLEPIDIYLVSSILTKANPEEADLENITRIMNNIMLAKQGTLRESQSSYNATDRILYSFDLIANAYKKNQTDLLIQTDNLISFTFDCNTTDYAGLALIRDDEDFEVLKLTRRDKLEDLTLRNGLEVVTYLPDVLLVDLASEHPKIVINVFLNDVLFNDDERKSVARNFGILLDEKKKLKDNITLLFKPEHNITKGACAFWNYGFDKEDPIFGKWFIDNDAVIYKSFHKCEFWHVTHFGLLISEKIIVEDTLALEIITDIECALSLVGFFGIFTTGALFKTWRNNRGNRILLHYSFVSCWQIALLYFSGVIYKEGTFFLCVAIGACLQYTLLSQFGWMLVISYLQYKRYVTVFQGSQKFMLIKSFMIAYFFPIIPVTLLLVFHMESYTKGRGGICYPTGYGLVFGILIPIIVVVVVNIIIFLRIVLELFCLRRNKCVDDDIFLLRLRLVVLMFFMLGVTWGLGFAAQIFESPTLLYAFSCTATLQGFIIFVFFIVFNKHTRVMYVYMCKKYNYT